MNNKFSSWWNTIWILAQLFNWFFNPHGPGLRYPKTCCRNIPENELWWSKPTGFCGWKQIFHGEVSSKYHDQAVHVDSTKWIIVHADDMAVHACRAVVVLQVIWAGEWTNCPSHHGGWTIFSCLVIFAGLWQDSIPFWMVDKSLYMSIYICAGDL
jgi:hypothetical protein